MTSVPPPIPPSGDLPPTPPPIPPIPSQPPLGGQGRPPLRRSSTNRMLGGVCGGLAEYSGVDPVLWRVGFVALTVIGAGAGVLVYLLLWVLMAPPPGSPDKRTGPLDQFAGQLHEKVYASRWMPPRS